MRSEEGHLAPEMDGNSAFSEPGILSSEQAANLAQICVLVVGAGGLGCEILKNLAGSGFRHIHVIDMDNIDLSNLNRQFLFREQDIGQPKAEIAARRVQMLYRSNDVQVVPHVKRIEDMSDSFYQQFQIVVCGLDSVAARRWINAKLVSLCFEDPSPAGLRPLIDGGSEGFRGQCRVILPGITPCYECTLDLAVAENEESFPLCTIASIPRLPEHCIEWAKLMHWPQQKGGGEELDTDNEEHMNWLCVAAQKRAAEYGIQGVTLELVYGVVKRIVPAVASTNAVVAAACSLEAFKLAAGVGNPLSNYFMYAGDEGIFTSVFEFQKKETCLVCGDAALNVVIHDEDTLLSTLQTLKTTLGGSDPLPSMVAHNGMPLYMHSPPSLQTMLQPNLSKCTAELVNLVPASAVEVSVTHPSLMRAIRVSLSISP